MNRKPIHTGYGQDHREDLPLAVAIDVGTHSVRALVASFRKNGQYRLIDDLRIPTGLGVGLKVSGRVSSEGCRNLEDALELLLQITPRVNRRTVSLVATSALRLSVNGSEILENLRRRFHIPAAIITGEEEARLVCKSAILGLRLASHAFSLIDIGAGSVEVIIHSHTHQPRAVSIDIGAQYLADLFQTTDPLSPTEWCAMSDHIRDVLSATPAARYRFPPRGIGTGGTFTTLANVHRQEAGLHVPLHGYFLEGDEIERLALRLAFRPRAELGATRGISPDRARIVPAGMCLAFHLIRHLGLTGITVCDRGLREGLLIEIIERETGRQPEPVSATLASDRWRQG